MHVSRKYPASGERQDRLEPARVPISGHVDDDIQISALDAFYGMDGRRSRYIRGEDARDLRRN